MKKTKPGNDEEDEDINDDFLTFYQVHLAPVSRWRSAVRKCPVAQCVVRSRTLLIPCFSRRLSTLRNIV